MKQLFALVVILLSCATTALGQTTRKSEAALEARIIALDTQGWEAWKNNDPAWFEANTAENFMSISSDGISNKSDVVKAPTTLQVAVNYVRRGGRWLEAMYMQAP